MNYAHYFAWLYNFEMHTHTHFTHTHTSKPGKFLYPPLSPSLSLVQLCMFA